MKLRQFVASAGVAVVLFTLLPASAGAATLSPARPQPRTYVQTCANGATGFCTSLWDLPYDYLYTRTEGGRYDFTNTRDWLDALSHATIVTDYPTIDVGLLDKFVLACNLVEISIPDIPVVGSALGWLASSACGLVRPIVVGLDWSLNIVANIVNPVRLFVGDVATWTLSRSVALFGRLAVSIAEPALNFTNTVEGLVTNLPSNLYAFFFSNEKTARVGQLMDQLKYQGTDIGGNLGELVNNVSMSDASDELCADFSFGRLCPVAMFTTQQAPPGFSLLVFIWIGFWAVFGVVEGLSWFARATDS